MRHCPCSGKDLRLRTGGIRSLAIRWRQVRGSAGGVVLVLLARAERQRRQRTGAGGRRARVVDETLLRPSAVGKAGLGGVALGIGLGLACSQHFALHAHANHIGHKRSNEELGEVGAEKLHRQA